MPGLQNLQNVHPLFVHFPIALILVTLFFEGLWWLTKKEQFRVFATYLLYLATVSAVATVITGFLASDSLGHDSPGHEFVHEHRNIMLLMSVLLTATTATVLFVRSVREGGWRRLLILPLAIVCGMLVYGADKGGRLVFEYGMGVAKQTETRKRVPENDKEEEGKRAEKAHSHSEAAGTHKH